MIRFDLICDHGHEFEGWFTSGSDFDRQQERHLVTCPACGSATVSKRLMAPAVSTARSREGQHSLVMNPQQQEMVSKLREIVDTIRANADDVGERFPEEARKVHYGETEQRGLIGRASAEEAKALIEEGIQIAPLPVLPDDVN
ncbi:DUF1178 family protein [Sinorhizobium sp. BG8]|uniref:DUF1178 family protein n=1 Tax=Sinorhizobium sp. BG8 TaxID=2613773 RepID=UPI00193DE414|nr:DUF1178 family protein [Sinorhizobium sp. BG8]QRM53415.1 DUF1178 family protein [Sinorhizobium sp. BG8]